MMTNKELQESIAKSFLVSIDNVITKDNKWYVFLCNLTATKQNKLPPTYKKIHSSQLTCVCVPLAVIERLKREFNEL